MDGTDGGSKGAMRTDRLTVQLNDTPVHSCHFAASLLQFSKGINFSLREHVRRLSLEDSK